MFLQVARTRQDSKKDLLVHQNNRHLLLINAEDPSQCTYLRNLKKKKRKKKHSLVHLCWKSSFWVWQGKYSHACMYVCMWFCPSFLYPNSSNTIITLLQPSIQTSMVFIFYLWKIFDVEQEFIMTFILRFQVGVEPAWPMFQFRHLFCIILYGKNFI